MPIRWFSSVSLRAASAADTPATVTCSAASALSRSTCGTAFAWASGLSRATSSLAFASAALRCSSSAFERCTSTCSWALASSACALASCARALWRDASYWVRWISNRTWPFLTSAPSSNRTCSRTPWMRARSSTVWTESVCATNSAQIGTVFRVTSATTTAGGGGPAGAASLAFIRSQVVTIGRSATKAIASRARGAASVNRLRRIRRRYRWDTDLPERVVNVAPPGGAAPGAAGACEDARRRSITDPRAPSGRTDTAAPAVPALANRVGSGLRGSPERIAPTTRFRAGWSTPRGAVPRRRPGPRSCYAQGRIGQRGDDAPACRAGAGRCSTPLQVTPSLRVLPPVTGMMARESSARVAGVRPRKLLAFGPGGSRAPSRRSEAAACAGGLVPVVRGKKRSTGRPRAEARASSRDTARTTHWPAVLSHHGRRVAVASDGPQRWPPDESERPPSPPDPRVDDQVDTGKERLAHSPHTRLPGATPSRPRRW